MPVADKKVLVAIEGKELQLSNLDKVLYPAGGFTKAQVIDYYTKISPALLPHLRGRPVTFKRYPDGVRGESFYQKECPARRPQWLRTAPVRIRGGREINYCLLEDLPSLIWAANLAALELHTSLSLADDPLSPNFLAFDLDPGPPAGIIECCRVALILSRLLRRFRLEGFPKTSGSKGLQVYVPLNTPVSYERTKGFARACAEALEIQLPELVVSRMRKDLRTGKVFIDWSQNDPHKTTISVYSLRARERPTVSTPVSWSEVEAAVKRDDPELLFFEAEEVIERFAKWGDLFGPVVEKQQVLPCFR